jgi:hypothetical protein
LTSLYGANAGANAVLLWKSQPSSVLGATVAVSVPVVRAEEGELVAGGERPLGQQPLDVPQELNLLLRRRDRARHASSPAQYAALAGKTHRTPPLGSVTSPWRRGMTWTWACLTVCPAAGPSLRPTLNPSG